MEDIENIEADALKGLKGLQKKPSVPIPFKSLREFDRWADEVYPLLEASNMFYAHNFKKARQKAAIASTSQMSSYHTEYINNAIRIVNNAISALENHQNTIIKPSWHQRFKAHPLLYSTTLMLTGFILGTSITIGTHPLWKADNSIFCNIKEVDQAITQHEQVTSRLIKQLITYEQQASLQTKNNEPLLQTINGIRDELKKSNQSYTQKLKQLEQKCQI